MNTQDIRRWILWTAWLALLLGGCAANPTEEIVDATAPDTGVEVNLNADDSMTEVASDESITEPASESTVPETEDSPGLSKTDALLAAITIFVLAVFVGFELITKVPPTLHTPLMSGSNAVSGITVVGALLMAGNDQSGWAAFFGMLAVAMATVNVVGGFLVTDRMLGMFRGK